MTGGLSQKWDGPVNYGLYQMCGLLVGSYGSHGESESRCDDKRILLCGHHFKAFQQYICEWIPLCLLEWIRADDVTGERSDMFAGDVARGHAAGYQLAGACARLHAVGLRTTPDACNIY